MGWYRGAIGGIALMHVKFCCLCCSSSEERRAYFGGSFLTPGCAGYKQQETAHLLIMDYDYLRSCIANSAISPWFELYIT